MFWVLGQWFSFYFPSTKCLLLLFIINSFCDCSFLQFHNKKKVRWWRFSPFWGQSLPPHFRLKSCVPPHGFRDGAYCFKTGPEGFALSPERNVKSVPQNEHTRQNGRKSLSWEYPVLFHDIVGLIIYSLSIRVCVLTFCIIICSCLFCIFSFFPFTERKCTLVGG